jgi:hypothetical protein
LPSIASRAEIRTFLAERCDAHGFERGLVACAGDLAEDGLFEG